MSRHLRVVYLFYDNDISNAKSRKFSSQMYCSREHCFCCSVKTSGEVSKCRKSFAGFFTYCCYRILLCSDAQNISNAYFNMISWF